MRKVALLLTTLAVLAAVAGIQAGGNKAGENFDGAWAVQSITVNGKPEPADKFKSARVIVKGNTTTFKNGDQTLATSTFKVDPTKTPKTIDVTSEYKEGNVTRKETRLGIYKREGDVLTMCLAFPNGPRPTAFVSNQKSNTELSVYKRVK